MCPVCGTPLALATEAPQANRERAFIQRQVNACRSKDQIKRTLVAQFGDGVLALPGDENADFGDVLVYVIPGARRAARAGRGAVAAAPLAPHAARTRRRPPPAPSPPAPPPRRRPRAVRPVIAADSVNTTVVAAFGVGFISFVSPCVLPLVPGYLSTSRASPSPTSRRAGAGCGCSARRCSSASRSPRCSWRWA